eukprot:TRINITY_DN64962_c0_g1_i1.p1 TRINITY_DN64962_c0_g1~~TRINITY_DN64962_c0_g1_i1.p1  ORF type:complete len:2046 (-),score=1282.45 TRINITY_DN64962_c0_g1_i1:42-6179(-)
MKDEVYHRIEGLRADYYNEAAIKIQTLMRGHAQKRKYQKRRLASRILQFWIRKYLAAADRTDEVSAALSSIRGGKNTTTAGGITMSSKTMPKLTSQSSHQDILAAVQSLGAMSTRAANVDNIVKQGGIGALIDTVDDSKVQSSVLAAGTEALGRMAAHSQHSTQIARTGGVKAMVQHINVRTAPEDQPHSISLLGKLSQNENNAGLVVREGGIQALTAALHRNTRINSISDKDMAAAAQALGHLTESRRAAKVVGRDHSAIKAVIEGIQQKPKFARLTEYSISCLANMAQSKENIDSIVQLGGIETLVTAMVNHSHNEAILREASRTLAVLAANPLYARMIGDQGGIELALKSLKTNPDTCGEYSLQIIQSLCSHPANTARLLKSKGIPQFVRVLNSGLKNGQVMTIIMRLLSALSEDPAITKQIIDAGGVKAILESLERHPELLEHNKYCVFAILRMAQQSKDTLEYLKAKDIVRRVAQVMEHHSDDDELLEIGKAALQFLATRQDLENAMNIVGRSRMKTQTSANLIKTGQAILVVGNLALLDENVEFIVNEGGIPVLLAVINGISSNVSKKIAHQVLVPGIRAVSRLLRNDNNIDEFISEGGVMILVAASQQHSDKEKVCEVCILTLARLVESQAGFANLTQERGVEAIITMMASHPEYKQVIIKGLTVLEQIAHTKKDGVKYLNENEAVEAVIGIMQTHQDDPDVLVECINFVRIFATQDQLERRLLQQAGELALAGMRLHPSNSAMATTSLNLLASLCADIKGIAFLQEKNAGGVVLRVMDALHDDEEVAPLGSRILNMVTGNQELMVSIMDVKNLAVQLEQDPNSIDLLEALMGPVTMIANICSNERAAKAVMDSRGLDILRSAVAAVSRGESSLLQEKALKVLAKCITAIGRHPVFVKQILANGVVFEILKAAQQHDEYESLAQETQIMLEVVSRNPDSAGYLIQIGVPSSIAAMVKAHPLNDTILVSATRLVARLAKGADEQSVSMVRKEGTALSLVAVARFMNDEDNIIEALHGVARLARMETKDGKRGLDITLESMGLFTNILKRHQGSPEVMIAVVDTFAALCQDRKFAKMFIAKKLHRDIVSTLDVYNDSEEFCCKAAEVLFHLSQSKDNVIRLAAEGVPDLIMEIMARHIKSDDVALQGIRTLSMMARDHNMAVDLTATGAVRMVYNSVRAHPVNQAVVLAGMEFAAQLASFPDNHKTLLSERSHQMIQWATVAYPKNKALQLACAKTLRALGKRQSSAAEGQTPGGTNEPSTTDADPSSFLDAAGMDSSIPAMNTEAEIMSLVQLMKIVKKPDSDRDQLATALGSLASSKAGNRTLTEMTKMGGIGNVVGVLERHRSDSFMIGPSVKILNKVAESRDNVNEIVACGGIGTLIRILKSHMDLPDILASGTALLGKLAVYNRLKVLIGLQGGVPVVLSIMERYLAVAPLLNKCCYAIANLAHNCLPNRKAVTKGGGVNYISFAMQKHRSHLRLVVNAARALSFLCEDDDASKVTVAKGGGSLIIIRAMQHHSTNANLIRSGMRCLRSVSTKQDTLSTLIHQGAVQAVIEGMKGDPRNKELHRIALATLTNLSMQHTRETAALLVKGGTLDLVMVTVDRLSKKDDEMLTLAFKCLKNLATDQVFNAQHIVKAQFVARILEAIDDDSRADMPEDLLTEGIALLTVLSSNEVNAREVVREGAPQALVLLLRSHHSNRDLCRHILVCLSKLSTSKDHAAHLAAQGAIGAVTEAMLDRVHDEKFLIDVIRVMVNLSIAERNAVAIAETSLDPLIECIQVHYTSQPFLRMYFSLLGNLSIWTTASSILMDRDVVPVILDAIRASAQYPNVLVKMIKVLTNFTLVGETARRVLINDGALAEVQQVLLANRNHIQLTKAAEFFVQKLTGLTKKNSMLSMPKDLQSYVEMQVPEHMRNLLTSGGTFTLHRLRQKQVKVLVKVSLNFESIVYRGIDKGSRQFIFPVKFIREVRAGACSQALRQGYGMLGRKDRSDPEASFAIGDQRDNSWALSLESNTPKEAADWVASLQLLRDAYTSFQIGL